MSDREIIAEKLRKIFRRRLDDFFEEDPYDALNRYKAHLMSLGGIRLMWPHQPKKFCSFVNEEPTNSYAFMPVGLYVAAIVVDKEVAERILVLGLP